MSRLLVVPVLVLLWQLAAWAAGGQSYILPDPALVAQAWVDRHDVILSHAGVTALEILLGLLLGAVLGVATALTMAAAPALRRWMLPVLVASQAVPVFALAPILVLWLGYGMASKIAMAVVVIYFPVTAAFLDGLRRTDPGWLDLARSMDAPRAALLLQIRLPAALPALASGLRVATAVAPIGAVIGEWVGSSAGLGYLMLQANARMQIPLMFAALLTLAVFSVGLYLAVDQALRRLLPWQADALSDND
ncbi:MAG TPA: ABC transporter permease [Candidatus Sulfotelmatobacter sp.]|jgi:putative hydroxymethylpyrimidine transport system permease protein|nr:ABC transporter permease [Candidatus Sulfotelmatobacter sp.]